MDVLSSKRKPSTFNGPKKRQATTQETLMQYGVQKGPFIYNLDSEDVKEVTNMVDTEQ